MQEIFDFFSFGGNWLALFIVSMIPLIELRGSIILGAALGLNWKLVFLVCIIGNIVPIPFVIKFGEALINFLKKTKLFSKLATKYEHKLLKKSDKVMKFSLLGLLLFTAIPLPGTGAWSASAIAALLNLPVKKSFLYISIGVIIAGIIMTIGSYGLISVFSNI